MTNLHCKQRAFNTVHWFVGGVKVGNVLNSNVSIEHQHLACTGINILYRWWDHTNRIPHYFKHQAM